MKMTIFFACSIAFFPVYSVGQSDAHTHGEARLTLVYEAGRLLAELKTPAANFLGFERQPSSEKEWDSVESLSKTLREPNRLIEFKPKCEVKNISVELPFEKSTHRHHDEKKSEDHQPSTDKHEKHHEHHHGNHRDVSTLYEWNCTKSAPSSIKVNYFDLYPGFDTIRVEWIVEESQGSAKLKKSKNSLEISR